jgi:hypothetical protein
MAFKDRKLVISSRIRPHSTTTSPVTAQNARLTISTTVAKFDTTIRSQDATLTYSMERSPSWKANWFGARQEIPRVLWNPKVPHRTHKRPPCIPIVSLPNPVPTPTSHFLKIHLNIILPSTPRSLQRSLSLRFPNQNPVHTAPFTIRATCPVNLILLDFITRTILGKAYRPFSSSLRNFPHSPRYLVPLTPKYSP